MASGAVRTGAWTRRGKAGACSSAPPKAGLLALVTAALFTGAALGIATAEQPARLALEHGPMLAHWQASFRGAAPLQAGLAVLSAVLGTWAWRSSADARWLAGGLAILANWPFTLLSIMPLNEALLSTTAEGADALTRAQIQAWGGMHLYRVGLGAAATAMFLWGTWRGLREPGAYTQAGARPD